MHRILRGIGLLSARSDGRGSFLSFCSCRRRPPYHRQRILRVDRRVRPELAQPGAANEQHDAGLSERGGQGLLLLPGPELLAERSQGRSQEGRALGTPALSDGLDERFHRRTGEPSNPEHPVRRETGSAGVLSGDLEGGFELGVRTDPIPHSSPKAATELESDLTLPAIPESERLQFFRRLLESASAAMTAENLIDLATHKEFKPIEAHNPILIEGSRPQG